MTLAESTVAARRTAPTRARGFTLLELMVTISVAAMVLAIGVPSFVDLVRNNRAATNVNELLTAFAIARSESIKRGSNVSVCRSSDGATCTAAWSDGWIVFSDNAATDTAAPVVGEVLRVWPADAGRRNGYDVCQRRGCRHRVGPLRAARRGSDGGRDAHPLRHRARRLLGLADATRGIEHRRSSLGDEGGVLTMSGKLRVR